MIKAIKKKMKAVIDSTLERIETQRQLETKASPSIKVLQRQLFNYYQQEIKGGKRWDLRDTGFRNYSQFEEDGVLLYIFAAIGMSNRTFVDIGSGNGINSNCANLAINFGWHGLFIDGYEKNILTGRSYYETHADTWAYPPKFVQAFIQRENINQVIEQQGYSGGIDLVSIDLDGNDYWIWDALTVIQPRVVVIETHVEFGMNSIVVPYDKDYAFPGKHPVYHGASPVAMAKLAKQKGYRLVGSNAYGFNTIYVKDGEGSDILPEVSVESVLTHPRNRDRVKLFDPIKDWEYIQV